MIFIKKTNRAVTSILSTIIIFTIMVSSLALALSQIIPSLERFQTESNIQTVTNTFLSFDASIKRLLMSDVNTSNIVNYNLRNGILDIKNGREITIFLESGGSRFYNYSFYSGEIVYKISGNYKRIGGLVYLYGGPRILVYSENRTASLTNIAYQTLDKEKKVLLYYNIFVAVKSVKQDIEVSFLIIHLNTSVLPTGQKEYFPIINCATRIQITKINQVLSKIDLGIKHDELVIGAFDDTFFERIIYPTAPATFNVIVNLMHIYIDFKLI